MKKISIGSVSIPLDSYVVGGTALLGIRESGKTYAAKGIAEQLLDYKIPIVVFDAIGVWRYLKVARQGGRAFKVVVAGGKQPDLPLTPDSAPTIVRAAIRENIPLVIDLYDEKLSKGDWRRIVQKCFRTLLFENHGLRHIFLEEAAEYAPQKVFDGETYAEVEKLVRMGGNRSLGITLINQRAQELNKAVLDLCENLVLMRQRGAHAIEALEKWIDKLEPDVAKDVARAMPHMEAGDAWVFTGGAEKAVRVHTAKIESFHPDRRKPDLKATAARTIDTGDFVTRLSGELPKIIEEINANDPKKLRAELAVRDRQIADLQRQLADPRKKIDPQAIEQAEARGLERGLAGAREAQSAALATVGHRILDLLDNLHDGVEKMLKEMKPVEPKPGKVIVTVHPSVKNMAQKTRQVVEQLARAAVTHVEAANGEMPPSVRKILDTFHKSYPVSLSFDAAARRAGISSRSSSYNRIYRKAIETSPELERDGDRFRGRAVFAQLGGLEPGSSIETWAHRLPPAYAKMLRAVHQHGPIDRATIAAEAGVSPTSSGLGMGLKELVRLQLIVKGDGGYQVAEGLG